MSYRAMDPQHVRQHYASMSDATLLEIHSEDLVPAARALWIEELERRGLRRAAESLAARHETGDLSAADYDHLVRIAEFAHLHESIRVRDLLTAAGIPVMQTRAPNPIAAPADQPPEGTALMVPAEHATAARQIIADFKAASSAAGE